MGGRRVEDKWREWERIIRIRLRELYVLSNLNIPILRCQVVKLCHLIEPCNFIAQNLQKLMSCEQQLKQNAPKYQLKRFRKIVIPSVHVISDLNRIVINLVKFYHNLDSFQQITLVANNHTTLYIKKVPEEIGLESIVLRKTRLWVSWIRHKSTSDDEAPVLEFEECGVLLYYYYSKVFSSQEW